MSMKSSLLAMAAMASMSEQIVNESAYMFNGGPNSYYKKQLTNKQKKARAKNKMARKSRKANR